MSDPIFVVNRPNVVKFNVFSFVRFLPFSFVAESGQTEFELDVTPVVVTLCAINGSVQDGAKAVPDFTVDGNKLILSEGVDEGDLVYGVVQY